MCHRLDRRFFQELADLDPAEVCTRAQCDYDREGGLYLVRTWAGVYAVHPERGEIAAHSPGTPAIGLEFGLTVLFYLLRAKDLALAGEWISEKDLPGGITFFRGPHALPGDLVATRFGEDGPGFRQRCEELGGTALAMGDAAYVFRVLPRAPVAVVLWRADEEFPAEAKLRFDRTISAHLPLDVIFGLGTEVCSRISGAACPHECLPGAAT